MKAFPNIIDISNRRHYSNARLWLQQVRNNEYKMDTDNPFILEYMRLGYPSDVKCEDFMKCKEYCMVDPEGGPYMEIGTQITEDLKISRIHYDSEVKHILITLE